MALFHAHGHSPNYPWSVVRNSYLLVDFFLVLSGFVIAWNYGTRLGSWADVQHFLMLRLGRVYPLHRPRPSARASGDQGSMKPP